MRMLGWFAVWAIVLPGLGTLWAQEAAWEHPVGLLDAYDADESCWVGMGASGEYPIPVVPAQWLVGSPPSELSAVTIPEDHWVDLLFAGPLSNGPGDDLEFTESGKAGEQALVFLTDGADQEYVVGVVQAEDAHVQATTYISLDLPEIEVPFVPKALRLVAVDYGGSSPGFDLGYVHARILRECGPQARYPVPVSGARDVPADANLVWTPACDVSRQSLYLSDVRSLVEAADASVQYQVLPADANSVAPPELRLGATYYWRVDSADASEPNEFSPGEVWSFTVADTLPIEDFDAYDWWHNFLYLTWSTRGRGRVALEAERTYRSCRQSMAFSYYYDAVKYSEAYRRFESPQDWTRSGAALLRLWLHGERDNATEGQMYITVSDGTVEQRSIFAGDPEILTRLQWSEWRVALADFHDVNLAHVESVAMGFVWPAAQTGQFGSGTVYVDDITLHPAQCFEERRPTADLTCDCVVDYEDLEQMASTWLAESVHTVPVSEPNEPVLWYRFDGSASDSVGTAHGQLQGRPTYAPGVRGKAISLLNQGDAVTVSHAADLFDGIREAVTIAFWQKGHDSSHLNDTLCCSNYVYGVSNPAIAVHLGCWRQPGQYRWDCGAPWSFENRLAGRHQSKDEWTGPWNHWAFTKDIRVGSDERKGEMRIYLNGVLYDSKQGTDTPIEDITSFTVGSGWYGSYDGLIDDFQIYDYALSEAEAAYLASDGTGRLERSNGLPADLDDSDRVDLVDFGALGRQWLDDQMWP
ncbi:MAG: LamG domain-containing protein [Phycisphaerales bacterium]|nr:MAG: LamG domain-containing protein [Phycisphaerales bacterium]